MPESKPPRFPEAPDDLQRVCAVCGRTLDYIGWVDDKDSTRNVGLGWDHTLLDKQTGEADHPAVPVLREEVPGNPRCDFCIVGTPMFVVPARDFVASPPRGSDIATAGHGSYGDWAACPECASLVRADKWAQLVHRTWLLSPRRGVLPATLLKADFHATYCLLREHITGPPYPISEEQAEHRKETD